MFFNFSKFIAPCTYSPTRQPANPVWNFETELFPFVGASHAMVCAFNPVVCVQFLPKLFNFQSWKLGTLT